MKSLQQASRLGCGWQVRSQCWHKLAALLLAVLVMITAAGWNAPPSQAKATKTPKATGGGNAYDVIALVNQLRASNGLAPLEVNGALMAAAQAHSNYQASTGGITHTGAGGTSPKGRAIAAGYGGGATVGVSENIYGGNGASAAQAVQWWQGDGLHLNTMLGANYQHIGAGVATDGSLVYYTLDVGYIAGSAGSGSSGTTGSGSGANPAPGSPPATAVAFYPVKISTPGPDGSIVHTVQTGQTLWTIAAIYKIQLPELLQLNGLSNNAFIHPGDKLVIKPAEAGPLPVGSQTGTAQTPSATTTPTLTPTAVPATAAALLQPAQTSVPAEGLEAPPAAAVPPRADPLLLIIAALVVGGTALVILGSVLKRRGEA